MVKKRADEEAEKKYNAKIQLAEDAFF